MLTLIIVVAAAALVVSVLLAARMWRRPAAPGARKASTGGSATALADNEAAPPVRDGDEDEGTTLASDLPPSIRSSGISVSMEIDTISAELELDLEQDAPSGPVPRILVTAVGRTDAGRRRKHNEDAYLVLPAHSLYVIADGMGGYAAGEVASQMAIDVIARAFETGDFGGSPIPGLPRRGDELVRAIQTANAAILKQARSNEAQAGMGTTLVAARFSPNRKRVYVAHVGDSRAYRLRRGELKQLTVDHTLGALGIQGPNASKLSRAVGVFDQVDVDLTLDEPERGDYYILCSDGLSKMVPEPRIQEIIVGARDLEAAVRTLIEEANARGGKDNVTVIVVRVDDPVQA